MTGPDTSTENPQEGIAAARDTARRETFRLARDGGAPIVTRPMFRGESEPVVREVEPLAGARARSGPGRRPLRQP